MTYTMHYDSPLGKILLASDEEGMTGVWFEAQKYFAAKLPPEHEEGTTPVLGDACRIEHNISDESFSRLKETATQKQD